MNYYVGIDLGTSSVKTLLLNSNGEKMEQSLLDQIETYLDENSKKRIVLRYIDAVNFSEMINKVFDANIY